MPSSIAVKKKCGMRKWVLAGVLTGLVFGMLQRLHFAYEPTSNHNVSLRTAADSPANPFIDITSAASAIAPAADRVEIAKSTSGIPIHLIRRRPIAPPTPPYGPKYAALDLAAEAGDVVSQYRLGLLLYDCRDVPADSTELDRDIERTYQTRRRDGFEVSDPQVEENILRRRFGDCSGVPAEARGRYRNWLKSAADSGLIEAQLDLPLRLPQAEYCQYLSECSSAQRDQQEALQKEAIDYESRARDAGSANALWTIGAWNAEGEVVDENDIEAYANFRALDEVNEAAGQPKRFDQMLSDLRNRLRPADLITAEARADEILSNPNCCVLTP